MTPERLDQIETALLRAACDAPLDGRQRYVKLGLELVEGLRRSKELERGAESKAATYRQWYQAIRELLRDGVAVLGMGTGTEAWQELKNRFLAKVRDNV